MSARRFVVIAVIAIFCRVAVIYSAPLLGLPRLPLAHMLGALYGGNDLIGWFLFISSGAILCVVYELLFLSWLPFDSIWLNGLLFGSFVFILSVVNILFFHIAGMVDPGLKGHLTPALLLNFISCILFGLILSRLQKEPGRAF